jgi:hypothetical protein
VTPYDLIADCDGILYKVQVKCGSYTNVNMHVDLRRPNAKERIHKIDDYDVHAVD